MIWIGGVLAFLFLVNGAPEVSLGLVALGSLLVWQLSRPTVKADYEDDDPSDRSDQEPEGELGRESEKPKSAYCIGCGRPLQQEWKHCPYCGSARFSA